MSKEIKNWIESYSEMEKLIDELGLEFDRCL